MAETSVCKGILFSFLEGEQVLTGENTHVKGNMTLALFGGGKNVSARQWH